MNDSSFYSILRSAHSGWRYIVFLLIVLALVSATAGWLGNKPYTSTNRKINLFTLIATHIQIVFGLVLYFISPYVEAGVRYWKIEHISMMLFAAVLITVGNSRSKKAITDKIKHRSIALYFGLGLIIIVAAIFAMMRAEPGRTFFEMR